MKNILKVIYNDIISIENLCEAWCEFLREKKHKKDVADFSLNLMKNISALHEDLKNKTYKHGKYIAFSINDPKPRDIHKATVRDRLLHHAIYRKVYPFFDTIFIADSYSCRNNKGTHRAMNRFRDFAYKVSKNHTRTCFVLKCDIRKFFASINHYVLLQILKERIEGEDIVWLLSQIVSSFDSGKVGVGLPLGNLTSQLLVNIYMNEFDQFIKHKLKVKYYVRYADDFVVLSDSKKYLEDILESMTQFLEEKLCLQMHPDKVFIKTFASGVDFLGFVHFPTHRVLRTVTKRRMFRKVNEKNVTSYLGLLSHGNTKKLEKKLLEYVKEIRYDK